MIKGIDHLLIAVDNLDAAMATYRALGFQVLRGGEHPQFGTHNALIPLVDGAYIELIAVKDRALALQYHHAGRVARTLERDNRWALFALDSDDLEQDVADIRQRGLDVDDPTAGERVRPDGVRVAWQSAHPTAEHLPFLIQDVTPREMRIAPPSEGHRMRLQGVRLAAVDPRIIQDLQAVIGWEAASGVLDTGRGRLEVVPGETDGEIVEVVLETDNLAAVRNQWETDGVSYQTTAGEGLVPSESAGARLVVVGQTV